MTPRDFSTILIANRGEIVLRIVRTARRLGYRTVAVYSAEDRDAPHVRAADDAVALSATDSVDAVGAREPYLNVDAVVAAARARGADAIHPGYGFLSERPDFAARCENEGLVFIGPSAAAMRALGDKARAKRLLADRGIAFLPGYFGSEQDDATLLAAAHETGFPLMIKAAAGGGGRGMRLVNDRREFADALAAARREARTAFGDATLLFERALVAPRHVEVQIVGDRFGNVVHFGERDCSVQRRFQKLIEEAPSPAVDDDLRTRLGTTAVAVARAADYCGAGTIEFLLDDDGAFYFIEANARLQVEHPVTEAVTGIDLVEWQLRVARGEPLPLAQNEIRIAGHAIEARLCAEDPAHGFLPQSGTLVRWHAPDTLRVDHALESGYAISPSYDSMIAKLVAYGSTREDARRKLADALERTVALGITTNATFLLSVLDDATFVAGNATTALVDEIRRPTAIGPTVAAEAPNTAVTGSTDSAATTDIADSAAATDTSDSAATTTDTTDSAATDTTDSAATDTTDSAASTETTATATAAHTDANVTTDSIATTDTTTEAAVSKTQLAHARALAAVLHAQSAAYDAGFGGWEGWSANARPPSAVHLEAPGDGARTLVLLARPGRTEAVSAREGAAQIVATIGAATYVVAVETAVRRARDARLRADVDGHPYDVAYAEAGDRLYVALGARTFAFRELSRVPAAARNAVHRDGALRAPMTGHVIDVRVRPGDRVAAETVAVVLEAMKMEHAVTVPFATTIDTVEIAKDGHVSAGDVLVTYVTGTTATCNTRK